MRTDISDYIFNQPLMIHPGKLDAILGAVKERYNFNLSELNALQIIGKREEYAVVDNVAVIPVQGTLTHKLSAFQAVSGMVNYVAIGNMIDKAMNDERVVKIILDINSGGGHVQGCFDLVDKIYESRSKKKIYAIVDENAYSAAYAVASACHKIYLPRTAGVGSIGVISAHVSMAEFNKKLGRDVTYIFAGDKKADLRADQPLSDSAKADLQSEIDKVYDLFTQTIARNRNLSVEAVRETQAGTYMGEDAVKAGFADQVLSVEDILKQILNDDNKENIMEGNQTVSLTEQLTEMIRNHEVMDTPLTGKLKALISGKPMASISIADIQQLLDGHKEDPKVDVEALIKTEQGKSLTNRREIYEACEAVGRVDLAGQLLVEDMTLDDAQKKLTDLQASEDETIPTIGNLQLETAVNSEENPLLLDIEQRIKEANKCL